MEFVAQCLGRRLAYTYEVVVLTPASGSSCAPNNAHSPWRRRNSGSPVGYATRMTLRNRGGPSGFSRLAAPFMASAVRRANRKDLAGSRRSSRKGAHGESSHRDTAVRIRPGTNLLPGLAEEPRALSRWGFAGDSFGAATWCSAWRRRPPGLPTSSSRQHHRAT